MNPKHDIVVVDDAGAVAEEAARRVSESAAAAIAQRGRFVFVLSGGSTPRRLYETLASERWRQKVAWEKAVIVFGDERCVPPADPRSNYAMAEETLLSRLPIPRTNVRRMKGEFADRATAAAAYEADLRGVLDVLEAPAFDVLLLGLGSDGHTASLFPETAALAITDRWVAANYVARLEAWRLTLTFPALAAARRTIFLVTGADKAAAVARAFGDPPVEDPPPAARVVAPHGRIEVLLDRAAAAAHLK